MKRLGEWEKQASVWLCYPSHKEHWGDRLSAIRQFVVELVETLSRFQEVDFLFNNQEDLIEVANRFEVSNFKVRCHFMQHNDIWIRDFGPLFMQSEGKLIIANYQFNAWGEKFPPYDLDNAIPSKIAKLLEVECIDQNLTLEGGALEFNGGGVGLSTLPCLLGQSRNPGVDLNSIVEEIKRSFNLTHFHLFSQGLIGDHTDGHIDNLARFIDENTLLIASAENNDPQFKICEQLYAECQELLKDHPNLEILKMPLPPSKFHHGEILSRSYLNFIFVNGAMIVPTFNENVDSDILNLFKKLIPTREVIGIDCRELVLEGGGLHCMTCHQPFLSL